MDSQQKENVKHIHVVTNSFVTLLENAVTRSLTFLPEDEFLAAYKEIFKSHSFTLKSPHDRPPLSGSSTEAKKLRQNLNDFVLKNVKEEIDIVVTEENLDKKFGLLEELKKEFQFQPKIKAWRPPGNVEMHLKPFNLNVKVEERNSLLRKVNTEREKLDILKARIESKRKKARKLNSTIEDKMHKIQIDVMSTQTTSLA